jgi:hypothetical protein
MSAQKKNSYKQNASKKHSTSNNKVSTNNHSVALSYLIWFFKNAIAGVICYILIFQCIEGSQGYNWVYNSMLKENYKLIQKHPNLSMEKKLGSKFGFNYAYFKYITDHTPEDAVILYPNYDAFFPKGRESKFTSEPFNRIYATYFLYPRKLVYPAEIEKTVYGKQITHVAIVNGWGYDYLEYQVANHVDNTVLPIKQPEQHQKEQ